MKAGIEIEIVTARAAGPLQFDVVIHEGASETRHRVSMSRADFSRLGKGRGAERVIEAAFRFLLDREPKESILSRFDVSVISHYFPQFEHELARYFER